MSNNQKREEFLDIPTSLRTVRVFYPYVVRHPLFERLNDITQLSFVDKVYRGGKHSRYEHSVFVYHFTHELLYGCGDLEKRCNKYLSQNEARSLEIASLLHDIGHPPFSHAIEFVLESLTNKTHHERAEEMILKSQKKDKNGLTLRECISKYGVDPKLVVDIVTKRNSLSKIISHNSIGTDKLAYTLLDAHHTSLDFRTQPFILDLLPYYFFDGKTFGIITPHYERVYKNISDLQRTYQNMYIFLYFDEEVRQCERMFERSLEEMIKTNEIDKEKVWELDEVDIKFLMKNSRNDFVKELNRRLLEKDLYTSSILIKEDSYAKNSQKEVGVPSEEFHRMMNFYTNPLNLSKLEEKVCEKVGLPLSKKYKVMCMTKLIPSRVIPEDVTLFNEKGKPIDTFFNRFPEIKKEFKENAIRNSALVLYTDEDVSLNLKDVKDLLK